MDWLNLVALPLVARICLVGMFPFSAIDKVINHDEALKQSRSSFLPGGNVMLAMGMAVEIITPLCIVFAWHDRLAAFVLAGYCAVTALLFHQFWRATDFWAKGASQGRSHFWDFLKNFGLVGGLLLLIIGGAWEPARTIIDHPLSDAPRAAQP